MPLSELERDFPLTLMTFYSFLLENWHNKLQVEGDRDMTDDSRKLV